MNHLSDHLSGSHVSLGVLLAAKSICFDVVCAFLFSAHFLHTHLLNAMLGCSITVTAIGLSRRSSTVWLAPLSAKHILFTLFAKRTRFPRLISVRYWGLVMRPLLSDFCAIWATGWSVSTTGLGRSQGGVSTTGVGLLLTGWSVCCGSTSYTALWVTGYFGDLSAILVIDELQRQAVDRRCSKKPSRLRNWSVCTHPTFTCRTSSELITVHRPKPLLPSSGLFQESSILHVLDTQRVCLVGLTTDSANPCRLLQDNHWIFLTGRAM